MIHKFCEFYVQKNLNGTHLLWKSVNSVENTQLKSYNGES